MRVPILSLGVMLGVAFGASANACQSDADCDAGSHCAIATGRLVGVCVNDTPNAPIDEQETVETPPIDDDGRDGDTCERHEDCGVGGRCAKQPGATTGVCAGGM